MIVAGNPKRIIARLWHTDVSSDTRPIVGTQIHGRLKRNEVRRERRFRVYRNPGDFGAGDTVPLLIRDSSRCNTHVTLLNGKTYNQRIASFTCAIRPGIGSGLYVMLS